MTTLPALPIRPPLIVHHMGALDNSDVPPNSLEAIRACMEAGAACIEIDVTALADRDYLLVHVPLLDSETTGHGPVAAYTMEQAHGLFFTKHGTPTPNHVPLLSQVVDLFSAYSATTRLQIDFKNMIPFADDEPLTRLIRLIQPLGNQVIVSTGADWQLRKLRKLAPWLDLGFDIGFYLDVRQTEAGDNPLLYPKHVGIYGYTDDHPIATQRRWPTVDYLADRCGAFAGLVPNLSTFYIDYRLLTRSLDDGFNWAEALHQVGIKLDAWTLDTTNPAAMAAIHRLLDAGVDQFTTNTPIALKAELTT